MENERKKVKHLVVDSGAFIKNSPLNDLSSNIYSLVDVVHEIKDKATKERLQVLPYELKFKEPSTEAIRIINDFAKKTGDYASLSATDIRLLALTYMLEKEHVGIDHLNTEPKKNMVILPINNQKGDTANIAGFYIPNNKIMNTGQGSYASWKVLTALELN
ncbi:RNA-binding protein NOB1 [Nymphon striatum]|nr:RNA-binding protein NOB1 [Nymphon striatum]